MAEEFQVYVDGKSAEFDKTMYDDMDIHNCGFSLLDNGFKGAVLFINKNKRQIKFLSNANGLEFLYKDCLLEVSQLICIDDETLSITQEVQPLFYAGKGRIVDLIENLLDDNINIEYFSDHINRILTELRNAISGLSLLF